MVSPKPSMVRRTLLDLAFDLLNLLLENAKDTLVGRGAALRPRSLGPGPLATTHVDQVHAAGDEGIELIELARGRCPSGETCVSLGTVKGQDAGIDGIGLGAHIGAGEVLDLGGIAAMSGDAQPIESGQECVLVAACGLADHQGASTQGFESLEQALEGVGYAPGLSRVHVMNVHGIFGNVTAHEGLASRRDRGHNEVVRLWIVFGRALQRPSQVSKR
jgi:hypothetical protein